MFCLFHGFPRQFLNTDWITMAIVGILAWQFCHFCTVVTIPHQFSPQLLVQDIICAIKFLSPQSTSVLFNALISIFQSTLSNACSQYTKHLFTSCPCCRLPSLNTLSTPMTPLCSNPFPKPKLIFSNACRCLNLDRYPFCHYPDHRSGGMPN